MAASQLAHKPPITPPAVCDVVQNINVRHPLSNTTFLSLGARRMYADDSANGASDAFFLPTALVLDACRLVSQNYNADTTYLSTSPDAKQARIDNPRLVSGIYYFHVAGTPNYDFCQNFASWRVPSRQDVPSYWFTPTSPQTFAEHWPSYSDLHGSDYSIRCKVLDNSTCVMCLRSGGNKYIQAAHIIPEALSEWYIENSIDDSLHFRTTMPSTLKGEAAIHDVRNIIALSADCRDAWDNYDYVHYPLDGVLGSVYVGPNCYHDAVQFHMRAIQMPERVDGFLLFVRFAITVFQFVDPYGHYGLQDEPIRQSKKQSVRSGSRGPASSAPSGSSLSVSEQEDEDMQLDPVTGAMASTLSPQAAEMLAEGLIATGLGIPEDLQGILTTHHRDEESKRIAQVVQEYRAAHPSISQLSGADD